MKKGLVLATIFALCSTMMVSAKEFNDARWQWFYSNSDYTGKVDLNTLSYDPSTDTARAWAVWVRTSGTQELLSYRIHFSDNSVDLFDRNIYRSGSDSIISNYNFNGQNHVAAQNEFGAMIKGTFFVKILADTGAVDSVSVNNF